MNGDMVNRGPNNPAVLELLLERGYVLTLGNHDDLMLKWVRRDEDVPEEWFGHPLWEGTGWCAHQLEAAGLLPHLEKLPMFHRVEVQDAPVLLISHGSPRHYREGYGRFLKDEDISDIVHSYPADVLIGSHTHQPLKRRWRNYLVLNTGAVGTPFNGDPRAQYLVLKFAAGRWTAEFRAVAYDHAGALKAFSESGFVPQGKLGAEVFREELRYARAFFTPFWLWTENMNLPRTEKTWAEYRQTHGERFRAEPEPKGRSG